MTVRRTAPGKQHALRRAGELTFKELLLELSFSDFDFDSLVNLFGMTTLVIGVVLDSGGEECVDECSLSEARLSSDL